MRHFLQTFLLTFLVPALSYANTTCTIDNAMNPNGPLTVMPANALVGQQFVACETGSIITIKINVKFKTAAGGAVDLYLATGNGSTIQAGSPLMTFSGLSDGMQTFTLNKGQFLVQKGGRYAFAVGGAQIDQVTLDMTPVGTPANPNLPDGLFSFSINGGTFSEQMPSDLFFAVGIDFSIVPTMSQWGLMIFGLLTLNLGVFFIRRKESVLSVDF